MLYLNLCQHLVMVKMQNAVDLSLKGGGGGGRGGGLVMFLLQNKACWRRRLV